MGAASLSTMVVPKERVGYALAIVGLCAEIPVLSIWSATTMVGIFAVLGWCCLIVTHLIINRIPVSSSQ